jgi:carbonic anhydrase/acetyltransferase-like protein (isoleucine patch superfamily)
MIESYRGMMPVIDESAFVHHRATVIGQVVLGPEVSVLPGAVIRADQSAIRIGARTNVQDGAICHSTGGVSTLIVGERVTVGHRAVLHGAQIGDDCIIGMGAILLDNAVISPWTIVGAGSLVPPGKKFPPGVLVLGSPARVVRELTDADRGFIEHSWNEYIKICREYRTT